MHHALFLEQEEEKVREYLLEHCDDYNHYGKRCENKKIKGENKCAVHKRKADEIRAKQIEREKRKRSNCVKNILKKK